MAEVGFYVVGLVKIAARFLQMTFLSVLYTHERCYAMINQWLIDPFVSLTLAFREDTSQRQGM